MIDIYNYLKNDHQKVSELMVKVLNAKSAHKREEIFDEIQQELILHAETEKKTFYAALQNEDKTEERIEDANEEHGEIKELIHKLKKMSAENEKWMELFGEFKHAVEHHVHEEEDRIFPKAKKILSNDVAKQLAAEMAKLKDEINNKAAA